MQGIGSGVPTQVPSWLNVVDCPFRGLHFRRPTLRTSNCSDAVALSLVVHPLCALVEIHGTSDDGCLRSRSAFCAVAHKGGSAAVLCSRLYFEVMAETRARTALECSMQLRRAPWLAEMKPPTWMVFAPTAPTQKRNGPRGGGAKARLKNRAFVPHR